MKKISNNQKGFSLVELMIVVAIIGVLATIGVPSYRFMIQRARKAEAKVALGALYTSQVAFFSEYGTYGNFIDKLGFDLDGTAATRIYVVGFPDATCKAPTDIKPKATSTQGVALKASFPDYYNATPNYFLGAGKMPGACEPGVIPDDGSTFTATASGLISTSLAAGDTGIDAWTIDSTRTLANVKDGVKK